MVNLFITYWTRLFGRRNHRTHDMNVRSVLDEMSDCIGEAKCKLNALQEATEQLRRASELAVSRITTPLGAIATDTAPPSNSIDGAPNGTKQAV